MVVQGCVIGLLGGEQTRQGQSGSCQPEMQDISSFTAVRDDLNTFWVNLRRLTCLSVQALTGAVVSSFQV